MSSTSFEHFRPAFDAVASGDLAALKNIYTEEMLDPSVTDYTAGWCDHPRDHTLLDLACERNAVNIVAFLLPDAKTLHLDSLVLFYGRTKPTFAGCHKGCLADGCLADRTHDECFAHNNWTLELEQSLLEVFLLQHGGKFPTVVPARTGWPEKTIFFLSRNSATPELFKKGLAMGLKPDEKMDEDPLIVDMLAPSRPRGVRMDLACILLNDHFDDVAYGVGINFARIMEAWTPPPSPFRHWLTCAVRISSLKKAVRHVFSTYVGEEPGEQALKNFLWELNEAYASLQPTNASGRKEKDFMVFLAETAVLAAGAFQVNQWRDSMKSKGFSFPALIEKSISDVLVEKTCTSCNGKGKRNAVDHDQVSKKKIRVGF